MKNPVKTLIPGFKSLALLAFAVALAVPSLSQAQVVPTGVNIVPFYDTTDANLSFRKTGTSTTAMFEIPGKPKHFLVLGFFGYLFTLYPDTNAQGQILDTTVAGMGGLTVHKYRRTQVADFMQEVMKGYEFGATGMAVDPNFRINRRFYVIYNKYANESQYGGLPIQTTGQYAGSPTIRGNIGFSNSLEGPSNPGARTVIDRYIMSADYNSVTRDTAILDIVRGTGFGSSNMRFGKDGMLYIANNSYDTPSWDSTTFVRKVLRIDVTQQDPGLMYRIPTDNPWYNVPNPAVRKEVYAFGFRNTYSMSVNFLTGAIFGAETGQSRWEEINKIVPGANYGWNRGGDASSFNTNSDGVEGPCILGGAMNTTSAAGAYSRSMGATLGNAAFRNPYESILTGVSYAGTRTCADFTNARWAFTQGGGATDGLASSLQAHPARVNCISPAFRGDPSSPFHGYMFICEINARGFTAAKEDATPELTRVGTATYSMYPAGCGQHNGPTDFTEDSYGNLYPNFMTSSNSGPCGNFDLFRLTHPQLTPLAVPRGQVFEGNPGVVSISRPAGRIGRGEGTMVNSAMAGLALEIPKGYSGADLYNVKGRLVWSYRGNESSVRVPRSVEMGILQVKFVR